jgi:hypothetical protein
MNDFPFLPCETPVLRAPITDEELAQAITSLVGRCAKELANSGMSASEAEMTAVEMVAEEAHMPVEEVRRHAEEPVT